MNKHKTLWNRIQFRLLSMFCRFASDRTAIRIIFRFRNGYRIDLDRPKTFGEKIQWLKLNWKDPRLPEISDKARVRKYIGTILGTDRYTIPLLGVWDDPSQINESEYPDGVVFKANHGSGMNIIVKPGEDPDWTKIKKTMKLWLKTDYSARPGRERYYRDIPRRIVAEPYMQDSNGKLWDYKFFCFDGKPYTIQCDVDRFHNMRRNYYDLAWNRIEMSIKYPNSEIDPPVPVNFQGMIVIASRLSSGYPFLRVDMYNVDGTVYVGELTLSPGSGMTDFDPPEVNLKLGDMLYLPEPYLD